MPTPQEQEPRVPVRVVIAEDEAIVRLDLKEMLQEEGYEVVGETGRGDEAVALVRDLSADLAILDIRMPGLDGLSVARQLNEDKQAAVVILTAFSQRNLIEEARDSGVLSYLPKPFQKHELVAAIEVAMARFREIRALQEENEALEVQLETRRLVDRAKGLLMDDHGFKEADAFAFIQKTAMNERTPMRHIAQRILDGEIRP